MPSSERGPLIGVLDYGMGNSRSVLNAFARLGVGCRAVESPRALEGCAGFVLPGVGAFATAMGRLRAKGFAEELEVQVIAAGKPVLGICLGMQLLTQGSDEGGRTEGFGWIDAWTQRLAPGDLRVPHVGWNQVEALADSVMYERISEGAHYYFDHSYEIVGAAETTASCDYGGPVSASLRRGQIWGTQFHPEKSQRNGLVLLRNFANAVHGDA